MVKKNILFVSFDEEYIATIEYRFADLIKEKASVEFITDIDYFYEIMKKPKRIDILIIPYGIEPEHPEVFSKTKIFYLTDDEGYKDNPAFIYKFHSVKSIVKKMDSGLIGENIASESKGTKVVGVYSVAGGTGNTLTSLALAYKLQQKGKRVMYVSTTPHQDFSYYLNCNGTLSDAFCYQCSINIKNALKIIQNEIRNEDFDFLPPFKNLPVSYQMKLPMYLQIISYLKKQNVYDYIIAELSCDLQQDKMVFLKECDRAILVTTQDKTAVDKLETFLNYMLDFNRNVILLCNRYKRNQPDYLSVNNLLRTYEFSEYIEENESVFTLEMIKKSQLLDRTVICLE